MNLIKTIDASARPSERLLRACAAFGLAVRHTPTNPDAGRPTFDALARDVLEALAHLPPDGRHGKPQDRKVQGVRTTPRGPHHATLTLLTGPSGSGKSTLLAALASHARRQGHTLLHADPSPTDEHAPLIDLIDLPLPDSLRTLAHAGLADATMLSRSTHQLSEGERFRLRLAQTMAAAQRSNTGTEGARPITLIIDEFASVLDRTTARCLSHALRRWLAAASHAASLHVILATAHDDVRAWLTPDLTITFSHGREPTLERRAS